MVEGQTKQIFHFSKKNAGLVAATVFAISVLPLPAGFRAASYAVSGGEQSQGVVLGAYTQATGAQNQTVEVPRGMSAAGSLAGWVRSVYPPVPAPETSAREALVFEPATGQVLYSKNSAEQVPIASLTKLMTALVVYRNSKLKDPITVTKQDQVSVAPVLNLQVGDSVMPEQLVAAMLVGSANDAANTLANHFPDRAAFLQQMNAQAAALGMDSTHFTTPIGFDTVGNYSTAADLSKLVAEDLRTLPYTEIWQGTGYSFKSLNGTAYSIKNSNALVGSHSGILSIKTGFTPASSGSMIVETLGKNGERAVVVVLGSADRDADTLSLSDYIFQAFRWRSPQG